MSALKHGLSSTSVLLPGEDAAAFHKNRRETFELYRPRTKDEAQCVETIAACDWRVGRYRDMAAAYELKQRACVKGDPQGLAGHICERDSHRWMHRAMDCAVQEIRFDKQRTRAQAALQALQKARRRETIPGALDTLPGYREFLGEAEPPAAPAVAVASGVVPAPSPAEADAVTAEPAPVSEACTSETKTSPGGEVGKDDRQAAPPRSFTPPPAQHPWLPLPPHGILPDVDAGGPVPLPSRGVADAPVSVPLCCVSSAAVALGPIGTGASRLGTGPHSGL